MSFSREQAEKQACNIYSELAKLRSMLRALELAAWGADGRPSDGGEPIDWIDIMTLVRSNVVGIAQEAEDMEYYIRHGKNREHTDCSMAEKTA